MFFFFLFPGPKHNKTVVCYISTWAVYRPSRGSYSIDNFDPNLCTIAIYAFAGLDPENDAIKSLGKFIAIICLIFYFILLKLELNTLRLKIRWKLYLYIIGSST